MDFKVIEEKVKSLNEKTSLDYSITTQQEKEILARTVKLSEEVGELCNDILSTLKLQRASKLESFDKRSLYQEFADVFITTIQLAHATGVDIERAINDKLKIIEKRFEQEKNLDDNQVA